VPGFAVQIQLFRRAVADMELFMRLLPSSQAVILRLPWLLTQVATVAALVLQQR